MTRALIFPGQGAQCVGMGQDLARAFPVARAVYEEVDDALGEKLSTLMTEGPEDTLTLTENAQPALMAVSMAVVRVLETEGHDLPALASHVAGHSLGEYSALCAAHSLSLRDTARLLKARGRAMQNAVSVGDGAMAAVLGLDFATVQSVVEEITAPQNGAQSSICQVANDNSPEQVVISGTRDTVEAALDLMAQRGARRSVLLPVSAPFHCALMRPAADTMAEILSTASIQTPIVPVVCNVTATATQDPEVIRRLLVEQVTGQVRWRESMLFLRARGVSELVECGSGKVLTGLARRIDRSFSAIALNTADDIRTMTVAAATSV